MNTKPQTESALPLAALSSSSSSSKEASVFLPPPSLLLPSPPPPSSSSSSKEASLLLARMKYVPVSQLYTTSPPPPPSSPRFCSRHRIPASQPLLSSAEMEEEEEQGEDDEEGSSGGGKEEEEDYASSLKELHILQQANGLPSSKVSPDDLTCSDSTVAGASRVECQHNAIKRCSQRRKKDLTQTQGRGRFLQAQKKKKYKNKKDTMAKKKTKEMHRSVREEDIHGGSAEDQQIEVSLDSLSIDLSLPQKGMAMDRQLLSDAENSEVLARTQEEGEEEGEEIRNQPDFSIQKEDAEENSEVSTRTWDKGGEETIKDRAKKKNVDGFLSGSGSFEVLAQSVDRGGINKQRGVFLHKRNSFDKFLYKAENSEVSARIGEEGVEAINQRGFSAENTKVSTRCIEEEGEGRTNQRYPLHHCKRGSRADAKSDMNVNQQTVLVYDTHENAPTECSGPLSPPLKGSNEGNNHLLSRHSDIHCVGNGSIEDHERYPVGEIEHFYKRRCKQARIQGVESSSTSTTFESRNQIFSSTSFEDTNTDETMKDACADGNKLNFPLKSETKKTCGSTKNSSRWSRELMNLIAHGCLINEKSGDGVDPSFPKRNKRKLQKEEHCISRKRPRLDSVSIHDSKIPYKEAQPKWRNVNTVSAEPTVLIGCKCKVYWPDDKDWYTGVISKYDAETGRHRVDYEDGEHEELILAKELVRLHLTQEEMAGRNLLSSGETEESKNREYQEMTALATVFEDYQEEFGHGEIVWAKIKGHPMWPAFVMDEEHANACGLDPRIRECSLPLQFFGSYDYARISSKNAISFSEGLLRKLYSKCKKVAFDQALKESERYMKEGKLPDMMSSLQEEVCNSIQNEKQDGTSEEDENFIGDEQSYKVKKGVHSLVTFPIDLGDLKVLNLGKIVRDSENFHTENQIWTEGYIAVRRFPSIKDPGKLADYEMEVTKDPNDRTRPLFSIVFDDNELVEGSTPSSCWRIIYQKLDKIRERLGLHPDRKRHPGEFMFGFSNPQISKLIQALPYARACFKFTGWFDKKATDYLEQLMPAGYKPVEVDWKHADRCGVCGLDEEYTNNLFLQCDKCRILVHMHCYGESEPPNGHLWLCQLCRPGAPAKSPLCCLCPVQGGAMKRTTDGRWAHLACAMWIPETCFVDVKHMEPIDGLKSINKERWKLTCNICKVPYGVCIQCSEPTCYAAFHVLCARSSGFVLEVLEDPSHKHRANLEEVDHPVQLLSYCRKHRQPKVDREQLISAMKQDIDGGYDYCPPKNISGCARTEPYNGATRRGRQEPEVRAAASAKRLYVEKMPYKVGGFSRWAQSGSDISRKFSQYALQARQLQTRRTLLSEGDPKVVIPRIKKNEAEDSLSVCSVADKYHHMCSSMKHRLTFGKSAIHGWGVFTKQNHRAGDMVIEYAGEMVRPIVADLRERYIYNTLVGAGTYMFRIDDEHVVDATREGSIAHLINHSCEPNCFSRVVTIGSEEHIIIFAKRDIEEGEELSYDYRFTSKGEQLECFCGFPSCRGFVNVDAADEDQGKIRVPCSEIVAWIPPTCI